MSNKNPLWIDPNSGTTGDKLQALINVVNAVTNEMYEGRVKQAQKDIQTTDEKVNDVNATYSITFVTLAESGHIDAVTATEHSELFIEWIEGLDCYAGRIVKRNEVLYQVNKEQGHTAQIGWEPENAPSLFKKIGDPSVEYPDWSQPMGQHDAYDEGDKVTHKEKKWISTISNNVWEPSVYGWDEVGD